MVKIYLVRKGLLGAWFPKMSLVAELEVNDEALVNSVIHYENVPGFPCVEVLVQVDDENEDTTEREGTVYTPVTENQFQKRSS